MPRSSAKKEILGRGERIVCQYRKERHAILLRLASGHRGVQRVIEGLPAEAIIDKVWKLKSAEER